jgi:hypothetical protein
MTKNITARDVLNVFPSAKVVRYNLPRGIESKIARQVQRQSTVVMHRRHGKIVEKHPLDETCLTCERTNQAANGISLIFL